MKKSIALMGRFLFFSIIIASTVLYPNGVKVGAAEQSGVFSGSAKQGDVNNDGGVNSIDFAHMRMYLLGKEGNIITEDKVLIADLNMDKKFDSLDLGFMRGYLLGKISGFCAVDNNDSNKKETDLTPASTPVPRPTKSPDGDDFTNSISKASYVIKVGEELKGKLGSEGDKDFMIFEPPVDGEYRVDVSTNLDTTLGYLYVEKVEGLHYNYRSYKTYGCDGGCYIEEYLTGGERYYVGIKNKSDDSALDSYTIKITKLN